MPARGRCSYAWSMPRWIQGGRPAVVAGAILILVLAATALAVFVFAGRTVTPGAAPSSPASSSAVLPSGPPTSPPTTPPSTAPPSPVTSPSTSETATSPAGAPEPVPPPASEPPPPAPPVPAFPEALRGQDVEQLPTSAKVVALTFDAGANSVGLPSILRTLADTSVPATFFLTGNWAAANPAGVAAIRSAGHRVGNHSMSHPNFPALSDAAISDQLLGAQEAITAAGADPRPFFRFPYGDRNARTIAAVNSLGYVSVRWTVDTLGWKGIIGGITAQQVADRALAGLRPGEIVLLHLGSHPQDGSTLDADALPGMIARMRAQGYGFVTLDALVSP